MKKASDLGRRAAQSWGVWAPKVMTRLGFGRLSIERQQSLAIILLGTLAAHLIALIIIGSWVVIQSVRQEETVFVAPPPMKTYEPRELEHQVKVSKRQRSSSRPAVMPRMVSTKLSDFALPEITVDPKAVQTTFQPKFKAVTGIGLGAGLGTGFGIGGFGQGSSNFDFFGIRGRGEKIAILVDVSVSMVEEERGGFDGFGRVRSRIGQVLDAFVSQSLFNIVVFADAAQTFRTEMVPATDVHKREAKAFLGRYNTETNYGLTSGNVRSSSLGLQAGGGTTRLDLALTAAFEQGADTILIISDGLPMVEKTLSSEQRAAWDQQLAAWRERNRDAIEAHRRAAANATYETRRRWIPPTDRRWIPPTAARIREGGSQGAQPGRWVEAQPGRWVEERVATSHIPPMPTPPSMPGGRWTLEDFIEHFGMLNEAHYEKKGKKPPVVHAIGYAIDPAGGEFLRKFTRHFKGSYRQTGKLK
jgi:hypothetical protein